MSARLDQWMEKPGYGQGSILTPCKCGVVRADEYKPSQDFKTTRSIHLLPVVRMGELRVILRIVQYDVDANLSFGPEERDEREVHV